MSTPSRDRRNGLGMIVLGCLLCSLVVLAAFTPVGLVAAPVGLALIVFGALRIDRASRRRRRGPV